MKNLKSILLIIAFGLLVQTNNAQTANDFIERARAERDKSNFEAMVKNADEAVKLDSRNAVAYSLRSFGYYMLYKYAESVADADKAIELNPKEALYYFQHSGSLINLRPADWKIALGDLSIAIAFDPFYGDCYRERARIRHENAKDFNGALQDANESIKLNPNDKSAFYVRADIYRSLNKLPEAESDYTQSLKLGNNIFNVYNKRGVVYFLQKKFEPALADFRQALKIKPEDKQAQENLEMTLKKLSTNNPKAKKFKLSDNLNFFSQELVSDADKFGEKGKVKN